MSAMFTLAQTAYAFYLDGTEAGSVQIGATTTALERHADSNTVILLRVRLTESGGAAGATTDDFQLQFDKNASGSWTSVTSGSSSVRGYASANLTDGGATTARISGAAGEIAEDGLVDDFQVLASTSPELLYSLELVAADLASGDALTFRVLYKGATFTYTVTPSLTVRKFTASAVNPATLTLEAWYDPSDISTLWQDSARTTAVTTAGDPVGAIDDKSGNARHLLQATAGSRPTYQVDGNSRPYLLFDGSDDIIQATFTLSLPFDRVTGLQQIGWTVSDHVYGAPSSAGLLYQSNVASPELRVADGGGAVVKTANLPVGENGVVTERHIANASEVGINTITRATGDAGATSPTAFRLGGAATGSNLSNIRFYGAVVGSLGSDLSGVQTWMAQKTGQLAEPQDYSLAVDSGTFTLTGTAAGLNRGYPLTASAGSFTLTGAAVTFPRAYVLAAGSGSYALSGTAATLAYGRVMAAGSGSFALSGTSVAFVRGFAMTAGAATFSLTGTDSGLLVGWKLSADAGAFTLTGTAAGLLRTFLLDAGVGSFTLTGTDAALTYGSGARVLQADPGAFLFTFEGALFTVTPARGALGEIRDHRVRPVGRYSKQPRRR